LFSHFGKVENLSDEMDKHFTSTGVMTSNRFKLQISSPLYAILSSQIVLFSGSYNEIHSRLFLEIPKIVKMKLKCALQTVYDSAKPKNMYPQSCQSNNITFGTLFASCNTMFKNFSFSTCIFHSNSTVSIERCACETILFDSVYLSL